jgi:hypothetical protein
MGVSRLLLEPPIYSGSNDKQKSYRGALIEREVLSNTTLSKVDHSERRPFFPFFQGQ